MPNKSKSNTKQVDLTGNLTIFFRGLCVFVTNYLKYPFTVLLPDARVPETCIPLHGDKPEYSINNPLFPHIPLLSIPKGLLNPLPENKPHKFIIDDEFVFPLTKHVIEIEGIDKTLDLKKTKDFENFIPNLRDHAYIEGFTGEKIPIDINNSLLEPDSIRCHNKLSALLQIEKGIINTPPAQNLAGDSRLTTDLVKTVFDKDNNPPDEDAQMLANCVCWQVKIKFIPKTPLGKMLEEKSFLNLVNPIISKNYNEDKVRSIIKQITINYLQKETLENLEEKALYKELDIEYEKVAPIHFQTHFQKIFKKVAEVLYPSESIEIVREFVRPITRLLNPPHKYYPFNIKLKKNGEDIELLLDLQLIPKIDKDTNTVIGSEPGNIFITNMPPEGVSMHPPFQRERDLDFALTYSVLADPVPLPYILPRRIPSPNEQNDQDQTVPPLICACVRYEIESVGENSDSSDQNSYVTNN